MEPDKALDKNPLSGQRPAIEPPRASFILKNAATEGTILNAETQRKRGETQRRRTLRESLDFGHSADWKAANPNGIASLSPGLRAARYPGPVRPHFPNPEKGCIL